MASPRIVLISRLILENKGQILLLAQTTKNGGKHSLPGGKVEAEETPIVALIRECKEEADINVNSENLKLVHVLHRQKNGELWIVMYFIALRWEGALISKEPKKFKRTAWFPIDNLPKNISRITKSVLEKYHKGITYSEINSKTTAQKSKTN